MTNFFKQRILSLLCLGLASLSIFSACRDDIADKPDKEHQDDQVKPLGDYIGKVDVAIEADVMPMQGDKPRLQYTLIPRNLKRAIHNTTPSKNNENAFLRGGAYDGDPDAEANYKMSFAPMLTLGKVGSKISGVLVFLYDDGTQNQTVFRSYVDFEIIESAEIVKVDDGSAGSFGGYKVKGRNRVRYAGPINFPDAKNLKFAFDEGEAYTPTGNAEDPVPTSSVASTQSVRKSKWRVQAYLDYNDGSTYDETRDADAGETLNKIYFGTNAETREPEFTNGGNNVMAFNTNIGKTSYLTPPCISDWIELYIIGSSGQTDKNKYTGINKNFRFHPQGVLLQYDLDAEMYNTTQIRRAGLISNVLDFAGYYDLNSPSIREAYSRKDQEDHGVPEWHPATNKSMSSNHLILRWPITDTKSLMHQDGTSDIGYPFDMPQLIDQKLDKYEQVSDNLLSTPDNPSVTFYNPRPRSGEEKNNSFRRFNFALPGISNGVHPYSFVDLGHRMGSRKIFTFWGMPRKNSTLSADQRATYMWISAYSLTNDEDVYRKEVNTKLPSWSNWEYEQLDNRAFYLIREINRFKREGKTDAELGNYYNDPNSHSAYFPGANTLDAFKNVHPRLLAMVAESYAHVTARTQPMLILHQTNKTFESVKGQVHYAKAILNSNLLISEVLYREEDGHNYTLVELYNPMGYPERLDHYRLVRMKQNVDHMSFLNSSGGLTDNLGEAEFYSLESLKEGASNLTKIYEPLAYPISQVLPEEYKSGDGRYIFYLGGLDGRGDAPDKHYLMSGQCLLLGANGYREAMPSEKPWFKSLKQKMESVANNAGGHLIKGAYSLSNKSQATAPDVLALEHGDGLALVKIIYPDVKNLQQKIYQIVDATAPVGPRHLAFSGTWASYKAEMDKHSSATFYTQQRLDGVNFPFIAPFRTQRLVSKSGLWCDDWQIQTNEDTFTPGWRIKEGPRSFYSVGGSWLFTPLYSPSWEDYRRNRPTARHFN